MVPKREPCDGRKLWIYGREPEVARAANAMTLAEAEELAKDVARALNKAWDGPDWIMGPTPGVSGRTFKLSKQRGFDNA